MKGYIYSLSAGYDPEAGRFRYLNDPTFYPIATLGACVPNIRRAVVPGDYVFAISGSVQGVQQYVVGGFQVQEKISALAAFRRFPSLRLVINDSGDLVGNIIVNEVGEQHELDDHENFAARVENYIVGRDPIALTTPREIAIGRERTLDLLSNTFGKRSNRVFDVVGRWRRLESDQIDNLVGWLTAVKEEARQ